MPRPTARASSPSPAATARERGRQRGYGESDRIAASVRGAAPGVNFDARAEAASGDDVADEVVFVGFGDLDHADLTAADIVGGIVDVDDAVDLRGLAGVATFEQ